MIDFKPAFHWLWHHAPQILTGLSCAGVVGVAVTSSMAGARTENDISELKKQNPEISRGEIFRKVYKNFVFPTALTLCTIGCTIGAERASHAQLMSMIACAGAIDYTHKKSMLAECNEKNEITEEPTLFKDSISGEFFESTLEEVLRSEYEFNKNYILKTRILLDDFYSMIPPLYDSMPEEFREYGKTNGWAAYDENYDWIEFEHVLKFRESDGRAYYEIRYPFEPCSSYVW